MNAACRTTIGCRGGAGRCYGGWRLLHPDPRVLSQWDIDNAVKYTLSHTDPAPADTAIAAATVGPSVVRVEGYLSPEHAAEAGQGRTGSGKEEQERQTRALAHAGRPPGHARFHRQRRGDRRQGRHPDQSACDPFHRPLGDHLLRRQQVRCRTGQRPAGKRSGGDTSQDRAR